MIEGKAEEHSWIRKLSEHDLAILKSVYALIVGSRHRRTIEVQITPTEVAVSLVSREQQHRQRRESLY